MQPAHILVYTRSRPFEPFRIYVADGRSIDVSHPEMVMVAKFAAAIWLFYVRGDVEAIDADLITGMKTLGPVNPAQFAGSQIEE